MTLALAEPTILPASAFWSAANFPSLELNPARADPSPRIEPLAFFSSAMELALEISARAVSTDLATSA